MTDMKHEVEHVSHNGSDDTKQMNGIHRSLTTVTLTAEQFESLYLQPRDPRIVGGLAGRLGNPTALGVSAFLLAHMPLAMDLLGFQGSTSASGVAYLGSFYACAGIGLYLACIMEWVVGNTFPCVVFGTFGGFWITYGIIIQPTLALAGNFAPASDASNGITAAAAGAATRAYNAGLGTYFAVWGILCVIFFIASLRTNVPFAIIFLSLVFAFEFIAAAYFHTGQGLTELGAKEFKIAGGFAFVTGLAGFYIDVSLLLDAVQFPVRVPAMDLSTWFLVPKEMQKDREV